MQKKQNINRRDFLKIGASTAISYVVLNKFSPLFANVVSSGKNVSFTSKDFQKGIPTVCDLCPAHCGIIGFLQNDYLTAIQGNPRHLNNQGKICARGIAGMNITYDPQRVLYPLKRAGNRGEGKWNRISWNEAIEEISNHLTKIQRIGRIEELVINAPPHHLHGMPLKFLEACGKPSIISTEFDKQANRILAQKITWGENVETSDVENSRLMINFGANPFESHPFFINFGQRIITAKINNGAKLITIDPRLSHTAGKSDRWIPIKPGTDAIVALAMANVIMQNDLYDADFIGRWTNVAIADLKSYLSQYSTAEAEKQSTIPAKTIEELALNFATTKPAVAFSGSSISKHINGAQNERSIMLLNSIIGNIDTKGGSCLPRKYELDYFSNNLDFYEAGTQFFTLLKDGRKKVDTFITYCSNPAYESPDCEHTAALLKNIELIPFSVAITTVMNETAAFADIILPAATYLEKWSLNSNPSFELTPYIAVGQPVINPQGEAKSLDEICIQLSKNLSNRVEYVVDYKKVEDFIKEIASKISGFTLDSSFAQLKKNGIWSNMDEPRLYKTFLHNNGFNTRSRKLEIDSSYLKSQGLFSLPQYIPNRDHIILNKNEFILVPFNINVLTEDLANSKWLSEIAHENVAWINTKTARALRLVQDSKISVKSTVGEIMMKVRISAGIHPQVIAISKGLGHWEFGKIANAEKFKSNDPDTELIWWNKSGIGVNPNFIIEIAADPIGKGQAWNDTKVIVKKV